jgi:hypothetical protein
VIADHAVTDFIAIRCLNEIAELFQEVCSAFDVVVAEPEELPDYFLVIRWVRVERFVNGVLDVCLQSLERDCLAGEQLHVAARHLVVSLTKSQRYGIGIEVEQIEQVESVGCRSNKSCWAGVFWFCATDCVMATYHKQTLYRSTHR